MPPPHLDGGLRAPESPCFDAEGHVRHSGSTPQLRRKESDAIIEGSAPVGRELRLPNGTGYQGSWKVSGWDPGWDPLIGFLDRPSPSSAPAELKTFGPVNRPKRKSDEEKLKELFEVCRSGNIREARALIMHQPYLLPYTDQYGFTALHHAQLSKNGEFYAQILGLFKDPRTFVKKMVRYENAWDLRNDDLSLQREELDPERPDGGLVTVRQAAEGSLAAWADVVEGDRLEGIFAESSHWASSKKLKKVMEELLRVADGGEEVLEELRDDFGRPCYAPSIFPLSIEFRGPACREILDTGAAALRKAAAKMRKQSRDRGAPPPPAAPDGVNVVVVKKPGRAPETCWPKKKEHKAHPHSVVLPTLLVSEKKKKKTPSVDGPADSSSWCHPLTPILEARDAVSRAATRVAASRKSNRDAGTARLDAFTAFGQEAVVGGSRLRASLSLPALVPSSHAEAAPPPPPLPQGNEQDDPMPRRRCYLPKPVVAPAAPRKALRQVASLGSLSVNMDSAQHSLIF